MNNQDIFNEPILKVDTTGTKPTITIKDVIFDDELTLVADPFPIYHEGKFLLFYELEGKTKRVIAVSESSNGKDYQWLGVVLDESSNNILLSFPYVFRHKDKWYMIPEQAEKGTGWSLNYLYKTDNASFPFGWKREGVLFDFNEKRKITDKAIIRHNGMWYVFYGLGDSRRHKLNIAMFEDLENRKPIKHPDNPIIQTPFNSLYSKFIFCLNILAYKLKRKGLDVNNSKFLSNLFSKLVGFVKFNPCRPGGKIIKTISGEIIVYLQDQGKKLNHWDIRKSYGRNVSAMIIDKLTSEEIKFKIHNNYVVTPTLNKGDWNGERMHTVSPINVNGEIFVAVDGSNGHKKEWSIAVVRI